MIIYYYSAFNVRSHNNLYEALHYFVTLMFRRIKDER